MGAIMDSLFPDSNPFVIALGVRGNVTQTFIVVEGMAVAVINEVSRK